MSKANVFLTYSHVDAAWKDRVAARLADHRLEIWDGSDDGLDADRLKRLEEAMKTTEAAVLLMSESFIASRLVRDIVIPFLHERRRRGDLRMVSVLVEACDWQDLRWLDGIAMHSLDGEPLERGNGAQIDAALSALAADVQSTANPGPPPSFEDVYREQYQSIVSFFGRLGVPPEECRDLAQETFTNAYKGIASFRRDAKIKTWLHKIARHVWLNRGRDLTAIKRRKIEVSIHAKDDDDESMDLPGACLGQEEQVLMAERLARLKEALGRLPPQRRRCVYLRIEGYKYREIAALMGISTQGVRSHLHQAREQLRELLGEDFGGLI